MKNKILAVLLIVSVGFNAGVALTVGHRWAARKFFASGPHAASWQQKKMRRMLDLTEVQAKDMQQNREALQKTLAPLREDIQKQRAALLTLMNADTADNKQVDALIADIARLQGEIEKAVVRHSMAVKQTLSPEQKVKYNAMLEKNFKRMRGGFGMMGEKRHFRS